MNIFLRLFALLALLPSLAWADPPTPSAAFELVAPGRESLTIDIAKLDALPQAEISAGSHGDAPSRWQGVALADVLRLAGAPLDKELRGAHLGKVVRITARDGYQVVFTLAELDAAFGNVTVLLATRHENRPLADDGPFRLVVPDDARAGRWIRNLVRIELLDLADSTARAPRDPH